MNYCSIVNNLEILFRIFPVLTKTNDSDLGKIEHCQMKVFEVYLILLKSAEYLQ